MRVGDEKVWLFAGLLARSLLVPTPACFLYSFQWLFMPTVLLLLPFLPIILFLLFLWLLSHGGPFRRFQSLGTPGRMYEYRYMP